MLRLALACLVLSACSSSGGGSNGPDASDDHPGDDGGGGGDDDSGMPPDGMNPPACAATEACDGVVDDNCDGQVDEGCGRCPLLSVSCPTGCCPVDRWEVATGTALGPSIAVADDGTIYFAYSINTSGYMTPWLAVYDPVPGTWRTTAIGTAGQASYRNRVELDAMGHLHVLTGAQSGPLSYRRSDDGAHTFSPPVSPGVLDSNATFDMAIDATGAPHIAYNVDRATDIFPDLRYAHLVGTTWQSETLDVTTRANEYPTIAIGFGNRPHIVTEAYEPTGSDFAKRYIFWNGNRWIIENVDSYMSSSGQQYQADHYFAAQTMHIYADDSREVLFTKHDATGDHLILAHRGPADSDTWSQTPITGATGFTTPSLFVDAHGKRAAISDGLTLHREDSGAAWTSTPLDVHGSTVAYARRGRYLYVAYTSPAPTVTVLDLGP